MEKQIFKLKFFIDWFSVVYIERALYSVCCSYVIKTRLEG